MPSNPYYAGPVTDHFDGTRFFVRGVTRDKTRAELWRWLLGGGKHKWPLYAPAFHDHPPTRVEGGVIRVSYVGHASFLIQTQGVNLLIDPVWAERASPFRFIGPKRVNEPGIALENLPALDAVLVTHNHYDHLDLAVLSKIADRHRTRVLVPLGNDAIIRKHDPHIRAEAHDWGARVEIAPGVAVHFEPAYHWSARGMRDHRMALWCAFVIETPAGSIYHVADTAWGDGKIFPAAREKHGDFRLAILPIGAYEPRWFMRDQHVNPEESVRIFQACGARQALAHHWGTFQLTNEAIDAPVLALHDAMDAAGLNRDLFVVRRPGEVLELPDLKANPSN